tara:strand:+ start:788 stop:1366 length:579 start_codon:yes stop_codon:yes gene_type:complete
MSNALKHHIPLGSQAPRSPLSPQEFQSRLDLKIIRTPWARPDGKWVKRGFIILNRNGHVYCREEVLTVGGPDSHTNHVRFTPFIFGVGKSDRVAQFEATRILDELEWVGWLMFCRDGRRYFNRLPGRPHFVPQAKLTLPLMEGDDSTMLQDYLDNRDADDLQADRLVLHRENHPTKVIPMDDRAEDGWAEEE